VIGSAVADNPLSCTAVRKSKPDAFRGEHGTIACFNLDGTTVDSPKQWRGRYDSVEREHACMT